MGGITYNAAVEGAIRRGDAIVTSNVTHIRKVAKAARAVQRIESVFRASPP
jgi:hypothetical protein